MCTPEGRQPGHLTGVTLEVTLTIKSFRHKGLEDFFYDGSKKGVQSKHAKKLAYILDLLNRARFVGDMNFSGSNLHPLKGDMGGLWALRVSGNWRVVFSFHEGNAYLVDYLDNH